MMLKLGISGGRERVGQSRGEPAKAVGVGAVIFWGKLMEILRPTENFALARTERALDKLVIENMPSLLTIETTSICNLRCVMCTQAIGAVERPKHLPVSAMDALKVALASASAVQLHGIGEPLASPSFWHLLENDYLNPDSEININTNLTLLDAKRIGRLIDFRGKICINTSIDAATAQSYARIRSFDFDVVIDNIKKLVEARGQNSFPILYINMTLMRENIEEVVKFVELGERLGVDGVHFYMMNCIDASEMVKYRNSKDEWEFDYDKQGLWNFPELSNRYLRDAARRGSELNIPVFMDQNKILFYEADEADAPPVPQGADDAAVADPLVSVKDCAYPWEWGLISSSGDVRPCCFATKSVGNINDESFSSIWNNETMQKLRSSVLADQINPVCKNAACKYVQHAKMAGKVSQDELELEIPQLSSEFERQSSTARILGLFHKPRESRLKRLWARLLP